MTDEIILNSKQEAIVLLSDAKYKLSLITKQFSHYLADAYDAPQTDYNLLEDAETTLEKITSFLKTNPL
jgi:hypothetical protein